MNSPLDASPEDLVQLRISVQDWLDRSRDAILSFQREDGTFWLQNGKKTNDEQEYRMHPTATARSYLALTAADRWLTDRSVKPPGWTNDFCNFIGNQPFAIEMDEIVDTKSSNGHKELNNFDVAHLANFSFCEVYLKRFYNSELVIDKLFDGEGLLKKKIGDTLRENLQQSRQSKGKVLLENSSATPENSDTPHFFVTLHTLRALALLGYQCNRNNIKSICESAKEFCIEQCFFSSRVARHELDIVSLVFATVIYCLYSHRRLIDKDLILACLEALAKAQQPNGAWPATHPIIREGKREPWHITSHEVALSLTWLYFQPQIPDTGRGMLLSMMEKYFQFWVVPSYTRVTEDDHTFSGWFDGHTITRDTVMGWATAIVCHFLSNYCWILNDHINRRVIESLNLTYSTKKYLVDDGAHEQSPRWTLDSKEKPWQPTWPDVPPIAWLSELDKVKLSRQIRWMWTDPSLVKSVVSISGQLSQKILLPIFKSPGETPKKTQCAVMLTGPPGTRKTTLVEVIAELLRWPLVTVPASAIFEAGFDAMEARASEVFRRLNYLSGCVIFFDEFEEFFRDRGPGDSPVHDRTIAAFTTSAMLPRLQELHDEGRCLIFLATNDEDKIDPAIKRPGRYDFRLDINHPTCSRIIEYLDAPTCRTLEDIGIKVNRGKFGVDINDKKHVASFEKIRDAVKTAVHDLFEIDDEVRFSVAEAALRRVAAPRRMGTKKERVGRAKDSLKNSRRRIEASEQGPPNLCDLP